MKVFDLQVEEKDNWQGSLSQLCTSKKNPPPQSKNQRCLCQTYSMMWWEYKHKVQPPVTSDDKV